MHERLSYTGLQKLLHWTVALLVIFMVPAGIIISDFDNRPAIEASWGPGGFDRLYDLHKNVGLLILVLMVIRIPVRLLAAAPPYYPPLAPHERVLSAAVHGLLYLLLILVPLLGWIGISAYPALPSFFGLFQVPGITGPDRALAEQMLAVHGPLGLLIGLLALLHIAAALFHGLVKGDGVLERMTR